MRSYRTWLVLLAALWSVAGEVRAVSITAAEYFIGNDPGEGLGTVVDPARLAGSASVQTLQSLVVSAVPTSVGVVTVGVRFRDDGGQWSNPLLRRVVIRQVGTLQAVAQTSEAAGLAIETFTAEDPATVLLAAQPIPGFASVSTVTRPLPAGVGQKAFRVRARSLADAQVSNVLERIAQVNAFPALAPLLPEALASQVVLELQALPVVGQPVAIRLGEVVLQTLVLAGDTLENVLLRLSQQLATTPELASAYQASVSQGRLTLQTLEPRGWRAGEYAVVQGSWNSVAVLQGSAASGQQGLARLEWREGESELMSEVNVAQQAPFVQATIQVGTRSLAEGLFRYRVRAVSSASVAGAELERVLRVRAIPPLAALQSNPSPPALVVETFTGADPGLGLGQPIATSPQSFVQAGPVTRALPAGLGLKQYGVRAYLAGAEEGSTVLSRRVDVQPLPPLQPILPAAFASWVAWTLESVPAVGDLLALRLGGELVSVLSLEGDTPEALLQRWLQAANSVSVLAESYQLSVVGDRLEIATKTHRGWRAGEYEWLSGSPTQVGLRQGSAALEASGLAGLRVSGDTLAQPQDIAVAGVSGFVQTTLALASRTYPEGLHRFNLQAVSADGVVGQPSQRRLLVRQMPVLAAVAPVVVPDVLRLETLEVTETGETQVELDAVSNVAPGLVFSAAKSKALAAGAGVKTYAIRAQTVASGQVSAQLLQRVIVRPAPQLEPVQPLALASLVQLGFGTLPAEGTVLSLHLGGQTLTRAVLAGETVEQILAGFASQIQQSGLLNSSYEAQASAGGLVLSTRALRGWRDGEWQALSPEWQVIRLRQGLGSAAQQGLVRLELHEDVDGTLTITEWDWPDQAPFAQLATLAVGSRSAGRPAAFRLRAVSAGETAGDFLQQRMVVHAVAPQILEQPVVPAPLNPGATFRLGVRMANSLPLTYVWKKDGVILQDQTGPELWIAQVGPSDRGVYQAEISNSLGAVTSDAVTLSLNEPVVITAQPVAQTLRVGERLELSVTATGTAPIQYQWRKNSLPIPEATSSVYAISEVGFMDAGSYDVVITNVVGPVTSASVEVTVERIPQSIVFDPIEDQLTTQSVSLAATGGGSGNPVTFAVTAGPGTLVGNVLSFTTSGVVTLTASQAGNADYAPAADVSRTFTVSKAMAPVILSNLAQIYSGTPRVVAATTEPAGRVVEFTYDGISTPPTNAGSYVVVATLNDPIYQGSATGTLVIGKAAQTISFVAIPDQLTTDSVNLTATGGDSGNPVTFAVTAGPGVITNNVLTFTTSGNVTVTASQAGTANHLAAEVVSRTFTVTKASAAVTLGSLAQAYDGTPRAATATTDPAGLRIELTYDGSLTVPANAGSYAVVATVNDLIYQGSATGTLVIGKAAQAITFAAIPDQLTTDSVTFTASGGDSGNPVTFAVTSGPGVITNGVLTFTTSGSVTITASQAGNDQYADAQSVTRSFNVTKATASVALANLSQTHNGTPRGATATTEPAGLTVEFTYDGSATAPMNTGSYAVVGTIRDPMYQGSASGTLEIGKAAQAITFAAIPDQLTTDSVNLTATGGDSGNAVIFAVTSGPGVIHNNVLTFTTSGSVTVTASQAGNANYFVADDVSRTLTVTKATSSIQFAERLHIDDGSPRSVSFSTDPADLPYALLYAGSETAPSLPGQYAVTASLDHPMHTGSGAADLTILGLSGRGQRLTSGSSLPQEATGTDFGRVILGRVATQTFTITNPGTTPVALTGSPQVQAFGEHAGDFQISVLPAAAIPAGGRVSFEVRFAPTQPGARQAVVSLACAALANGPITFAVGGFGALPSLVTQSISFNLPSSLFLSQGPVPLTATASSGLPVSWTLLSGPATLQDGQLILTGPGTVRVEARQQGGGNFAPANPVVRTLTVKADPTGLTLADLTQIYTGTPRPITVLGTEEEATVTYLINKLPSAQPPTSAGSYPVTVTAGPVTKTGMLVIARAPLVVKVADQRKLVGQANPDFGLSVSGWVGSDTEESADWLRPITVTTKAKADSPPGLYPITSSGGALANYTLIHRPGTLVVEGYVGHFEALLRDPNTGLPEGLLKLTVPSTSKSLTASLMLAGEAKPLALAGPLELNPETRVASAQLSRSVNATNTYRLDLTLSLFGELSVEVRKNNTLLAQAGDGTRLREAVRGTTVPQAGNYTAVLEPSPYEDAPAAPGWATGRLDAAGTLALAGRLSDGTSFTATLPVDVSDDYRLFVQPHKRAGAHLGGTWGLTEHPSVEGAWQVRDAELIWVKGAGDKDPGYRSGFGPLAVALEMDPWEPVGKILTLAQILGAPRLAFAAETMGSPSEMQLPGRMAVETNGVLRVLAPTNARNWAAKINPATGAFSGSFELLDGTLKRKVSFGGVLRQAADVGGDGLQGRGHYLLPPLKGAASTETTSGWLEFRRQP